MNIETMDRWTRHLTVLGFVVAFIQVTIWDWHWGFWIAAYAITLLVALALCKAAGDADRLAEKHLTQELREGTMLPNNEEGGA